MKSWFGKGQERWMVETKNLSTAKSISLPTWNSGSGIESWFKARPRGQTCRWPGRIFDPLGTNTLLPSHPQSGSHSPAGVRLTHHHSQAASRATVTLLTFPEVACDAVPCLAHLVFSFGHLSTLFLFAQY